MSDFGHPEEFAVGATVDVVRRLGRSEHARRTTTVARHTKTLVVTADGSRFKARQYGFNGPLHYEETPPYLRYTTELEVPK